MTALVSAGQLAHRSPAVTAEGALRLAEGDPLIRADEMVTLVARARLDRHLAGGVEQEDGTGPGNLAEQAVEQGLERQPSPYLGKLLRSSVARRPDGPIGSRRAASSSWVRASVKRPIR